jgi:hypothetical protein
MSIETPVTELGLSARAMHVVDGCTTVADIFNAYLGDRSHHRETPRDRIRRQLIRLPNCGPTTVRELLAALDPYLETMMQQTDDEDFVAWCMLNRPVLALLRKGLIST